MGVVLFVVEKNKGRRRNEGGRERGGSLIKPLIKKISQMDLLMDLNLSVILLVKMAHHHNF